MPSDIEVVRAVFDAYRNGDRDVVDPLLADEFVFTSPQDDHLDKATYLERCFPTAGRFLEQTILHTVSARDGDVFVLYEYELTTGGRYRNAEFITVRNGRLVETQVFFGGRVS